MHRASLLLSAVCSCLLGTAQNVSIVESQSFLTSHTMDTLWNSVAAGIGYSPTIVQQDALNDPANLSGTDVLVISSGVIDHSGTNHSATVIDLVLSGKSVFIQSEYDSYYTTNLMFDEVMNAVGADFTWGGMLTENLAPVAVSGDLSTTPNPVSTITGNFWYGCTGGGSGVEGFLSVAEGELGWLYRDPLETYGTVISTTSQEWGLQSGSVELMENILTMLAADFHTGFADHTSGPMPSAYPTPFTDRLTFTSTTEGMCELTISDLSGRLVVKRSFTRTMELATEDLVAGTYVYRIREGHGPAKQGKLMKR